ncbi:HET-domain-containing protein [Cenococcum geophilum]
MVAQANPLCHICANINLSFRFPPNRSPCSFRTWRDSQKTQWDWMTTKAEPVIYGSDDEEACQGEQAGGMRLLQMSLPSTVSPASPLYRSNASRNYYSVLSSLDDDGPEMSSVSGQSESSSDEDDTDSLASINSCDEADLYMAWCEDMEEIRAEEWRSPPPIQFGTIQEIYDRQPCQFCKLVLHLLGPFVIFDAVTRRAAIQLPARTKVYRVTERKEECVLCYSSEWCKERHFTLDVEYAGSPFGNIRREDLLIGAKEYGPWTMTGWMQASTDNTTSKVLDTGLICSWIKDCENSHHQCSLFRSGLSTANQTHGLLLIDTVEGNLIDADMSYRYVALSYVWGGVKVYETTKSTLSHLRSPGALRRLNSLLPEVVQDSITLVLQLGERYLWVDSLCIVQDDALTKHSQIMAMDAVYSQAILTIVAEFSRGANTPLPGVAKGTRCPLIVRREINGIAYVSQPDTVSPSSAVTAHGGRGWTYQETVLSTRRLCISHNLVTFRCGTRQCCDVVDWKRNVPDAMELGRQARDKWHSQDNLLISLEIRRQHWAATSDEPLPFDDFMFGIVGGAIEQFSQRELSYKTDAINAFSGIISLMERCLSITFICGIPKEYIDAALLWTSQPKAGHYPGSYEVRPESHLQVYARNAHFPSWSWAGHYWGVLFSGGLAGIVFNRHYYIRSDINGFAVWSKEGIRSIRRRACPLVETVYGDRDITEDVISIRAHGPSPTDTEMLCFWGRTVPYETLLIDDYPNQRTANGRIFTPDERRCGELFADDSECWRDPPFGAREWVVLSRGNSGYETAKDLEGISFTEHLNPEHFEATGWCFLHVMLIERRGDIYERIALGSIHTDAWPTSHEERKLIVLG